MIHLILMTRHRAQQSATPSQTPTTEKLPSEQSTIVPPHSLQLERAVLGLMLLSPAATDEIIASDLRPGGDAGALGSERGLYTIMPYTDPQALPKGAGTGKLKPKS